jgi:hypothetical protein
LAFLGNVSKTLLGDLFTVLGVHRIAKECHGAPIAQELFLAILGRVG